MSNLTSRPGSGQPAMSGPRPGTHVIVDIHADRGANGDISWSDQWQFEGGAAAKGEVRIPRKRQVEPGTPMHFRLKDSSGRGLRFEERISDAIWIKENECPGSATHDPEFDLRNATATPFRIQVLNRNHKECVLHYRLNFRDRDGRAVSYDPIIRNGGISLS